MEDFMWNKENFELKQLNQSNFKEFDALLRYAFQVTSSEMAQIGWSDREMRQSKKPIFDSSLVLGWFYKGHLASQVVVYSMEVNIYGKIFKMGGVTGVATYPEYTGHGLIHSLIKKSLEHMRNDQQYISFLYPYSIPFYRKQGWEIVSDKLTFTIRDTQLPKRRSVPGMIERVPVEHEDIQNVYKYFALQQHGSLIRSSLEWEEYWRWDSDDIMGAVYYNAEQKPLGYVLYYIENEIFKIKDMVYLNHEAKYGIWNYISAHFSMVTEVCGDNYSGEPIAFQLEDSEIDETIEPYIMARIVDVQHFLEEYPFQADDEKIKLYLKITDPILEWNNNIFCIYWEDGKTKCDCMELCEGVLFIEMNIQTLTAMLMGYKRPTYLYNNDRITMDYHLLHTLEKLIPYGKPHFSDYY